MLHIISRSPVEPVILERTAPGDVLLFVENAVLALLRQGRLSVRLEASLTQNRLLALHADLQLRGIETEALLPGIEVIDYGGFVKLTEDNPVIQSWC